MPCRGHSQRQSCIVSHQSLQLGHHSAKEIARDTNVIDLRLLRSLRIDVNHHSLPVVTDENSGDVDGEVFGGVSSPGILTAERGVSSFLDLTNEERRWLNCLGFCRVQHSLAKLSGIYGRSSANVL